MFETVSSFVANAVATYAIQKGVDSVINNEETFKERLKKVLDTTIEEYKAENPIPDENGKFAFYDSQIIVDELLKVRFFRNHGYLLNEERIASELNKNPNILHPEKEQLEHFLEVFDRNVQQDDRLKELAVDENYKFEIFNISEKLETLLRKLADQHLQLHKEVPKQLTSIVSISQKDIVGRETDLKNLRKSLLEENETALINGMGGIGKTTLAAVYISEFYEDYDHIAWLTLENTLEEAIAANYSLIKNLNLKDIPPSQQLNACLNELRKLKSAKPKLLVLDNAKSDLCSHFDKLPKAHGWHLLVTSRERIPRFHFMDLDFLSEDQAIELFEKYNRDNFSRVQVREIVNNVERHTLTIEILAKSARRNRWDMENVQNALSLDATAGIDVAHNKNKIERIKSYLSSIFDISNLNSYETYLLKQFTALPNQWIAYDFLSILLQKEKLEWKEEFAASLENIYEKGFILKDEEADGYKMHPVLVEALIPRLNITLEDVMLLIKSLSALLDIDQAKDNPIDKFKYIPLGDAVLKRIPDDTHAETSVLKNNLANVYSDLGEYEKARDLLEAALKSALENFGERHPTVAVSQSNLANVYSDLGEYEKARDLWMKAYEIFARVLGEQHPHTKTVKSFLEHLNKE